MSLADAVLEIVEDMEQEANDDETHVSAEMALKVYAKQLRRAVKAAEGAAQPRISAAEQHRIEIEKARAEFRKMPIEENIEPRMVTCQGGSADGSMAPIAQDMPDGAKTMIAGEVYTLVDGTLVAIPEK